MRALLCRLAGCARLLFALVFDGHVRPLRIVRVDSVAAYHRVDGGLLDAEEVCGALLVAARLLQRAAYDVRLGAAQLVVEVYTSAHVELGRSRYAARLGQKLYGRRECDRNLL